MDSVMIAGAIGHLVPEHQRVWKDASPLSFAQMSQAIRA
jgi:hypothetical protein